jgi:NADH-quinone oxidoreductase subunit C
LPSAEAETEAPEGAAGVDGDAAGAPDPLRATMVDLLRAGLAEIGHGDGVLDVVAQPGRDLWVRVHTDAWLAAGEVARDRLGCSYFCFLSVIDWLPSPFGRSMDAEADRVVSGEPRSDPGPMTHGYTGGDTRFQVFARLMSVRDKVGLTLKVDVPDDTQTVDSWSSLYGGANWHEREAWEMFGVRFAGHPNLRRLYLPTDFEGHPLRKDFPLLARIVKPWPGIVDVEPLPGDDDAAEEADS